MCARLRFVFVALLYFVVAPFIHADVTWVLDSVDVNPDNKPMVSYEKRGEEIVTERRLTISSSLITVKTIRMGQVDTSHNYDSQGRMVMPPLEYLGTWNFRFQIPRPPEQVLPGEPVKLTVSGSADGERKKRARIAPRDFSCRLVYRGGQGVSFDRHPDTHQGAALLYLGERQPRDTKTFTFRIPRGTEQRYKKVTFTATVHTMVIKYTYRAVEGPAPKPDPPVLSWISVEQRHLTYDKAKVTVKAKASYPMIGTYNTHDIAFTVRVTGPDSQRKDFDAYAPQIRRNGNDLFLDWSFETRKIGENGVKVTLKDSRFDSLASTAEFRHDYEHSLSTGYTVNRPVAEIMVVNRNVTVMRDEHSTVAGGVIVTSKRKYHQPKDVNWLRTIAEMMGEDTTTTGEYEATRIWERVEQETSHFVYERDRIGLWGVRDDRLRPPVDSMDVDALMRWMRSGTSSVVLEWENGVKGEAIWNTAKSNIDSQSGDYFTVGVSRAASGKWKETWTQWFGSQARMLTEQYVSGEVDEAKEAAIDWFLEREGITMPSVPGAVSTFIQIFNLSAGDTVYDDLVYLRLKSRVFVSARGREMKVFTFEGSPEIVDPKRGTKVVVKPGRMVTVRKDTVSEPRTFSTADLKATQRPVDPIRNTDRDPKLDRQKSGSVDIPRFNANVVKFVFFESADPPVPLKERTFTDTFDSKTARFVFWHLELDYPQRDSYTEFKLETVWYKPDGSIYGRGTRNFRMEAGWSGSYYSSAWGANKPGTWKPGTYRAEVYLDGQVIAEGSFTITGAGNISGKTGGKTVKEKRPVYDFSQWPIEHKLDVAMARLDRAIQRASNQTKQDGYSRAKQLVRQAKSAYLRYIGPDRGIFNGSTDPSDCPLGLMQVMRRTAEDVFQARAAWGRSALPPNMTRAEIQSAETAIEEAEEKINAAVKEILQVRGWRAHTGRDGFYLEAPSEYERFQNGNWPLSLRVMDKSGKIEKLVLLTWHGKPDGMSAYDFQQQEIKELRSKFADFQGLQEWQTWPGVSGNWFTYKYSWEGQQVEALVYQNPFGPLPWELSILAADRPLDMAECEEIVRSLTRE